MSTKALKTVSRLAAVVVVGLLAQPTWAQRGDMDCSDFRTQREAQEFFERAGRGDPHRLDRDNDGYACETLP